MFGLRYILAYDLFPILQGDYTKATLKSFKPINEMLHH